MCPLQGCDCLWRTRIWWLLLAWSMLEKFLGRRSFCFWGYWTLPYQHIFRREIPFIGSVAGRCRQIKRLCRVCSVVCLGSGHWFPLNQVGISAFHCQCFGLEFTCITCYALHLKARSDMKGSPEIIYNVYILIWTGTRLIRHVGGEMW